MHLNQIADEFSLWADRKSCFLQELMATLLDRLLELVILTAWGVIFNVNHLSI